MQCIVDGCSGGHFYPRPPRGGRRVQRASSAHKHNFYPRPPRGGRPDHSSGHRHNDFISIHALREEGDRCNLSVVYSSTIFLSTPSARRATLQCIVDGCSGGHFYPRPPRGGRLEQPYKKCEACKISIHALREEGDLYKCRLRHVLVSISIHALREEGDQGNTAALSVTTIFLSTPSARRATAGIRRAWRRIPISIHALREEGDLPASALPLTAARFLSTPSARRATAGIRRAWRRIPISIHALREEGDGTHGPHRRERPNFYPRPPRGGRPATTHTAASPVFYFYPRPPRGGRLHR